MNANAQTYYPLQDLVLPTPELLLPEKLYWSERHRAHYDAGQARLELGSGGYVCLHSFFNSFAAKQWRRRDEKHNLYYCVEGHGPIYLEIIAEHKRQTFVLLSKRLLLEGGRPEILALPDIYRSISDSDRILYAKIWSDGPSAVTQASFCTDLPPRNEVDLALVITHFKRESWVMPALDRLRKELFSDPEIRDRVHVYIVDNSQTLPVQSDDFVTLVPNKNLGGAGGFTRGLLEAELAERFTHCVFMDDDATMEIEGIKRTVRFLGHARPETCVAGGLFMQDKPTVVFESAGDWDHSAKPVCQDLQVALPRNLERYVDHDSDGRYGGWWFFAFPISAVKRYPFPYFVRGDDIAFGIDNGFRITSLLGVACWAESFESKDSVTTTYLDYRSMYRNPVILGLSSRKKLMRHVGQLILKMVIGYRYAAAETALTGLRHSIKSEDFWIDNLDMSELRRQLAPLAEQEKFEPASLLEERLGMPIPPLRKKFKESLFRKLVRYATLNGHLVPARFCPTKPAVLPKTYTSPATMVFPHTKVILVRAHDEAVVMLERDVMRAARILIKLPLTLAKLLAHHVLNKNDMQRCYAKLTTREFWLEVYPECRKQPAAQTESPSPVVAH